MKSHNRQILNELLKQKEIKMEKNVTPYRQTGMTCAIACMLMVLQYYGKIQKAQLACQTR